MYAEQRHKQILDTLAGSGRVAVADLAETFDVTTETIRRDLDQLARRSLLVRVHGGAVARRTAVIEPDLATRSTTNIEAKRRIAAAARELLPADPGASVLLDAGSTTAQLVPHLAGRSGVVVTHALEIAGAVLALPEVSGGGLTVQLLPGLLRPGTGAAVGTATVDALQRFRPDIAFLGCNGLDAEGFSTPDPAEGAVKTAFVERSGLRVVLADSSKAGARHLVTFAAASDIDVLVSDEALPEDTTRTLTEQGIEVIRA